MDKVVRLQKRIDQGLNDFLAFLLEQEKVEGIFTLNKNSKNNSYDYGLVTNIHGLEDAVPLDPVMPVNAAQVLCSFSSLKKPIAAVIRPCELRAFVELVKRAQACLEDFLLISYSCGGALGFNSVVENKIDNMLPEYWEAVNRGENYEAVRPTCKACEYFVPTNADITFSLIGEKELKSQTCFFLNTDKAKTMAEGFEGEVQEGTFGNSAIDTLLEKRKAEKSRCFGEIRIKDAGMDGLIQVFGRCVGCHGCSHICPICYCVLCDFESQLFDCDTSLIESEVSKRGAMRLPPDTVLFHLGRMTHMSFSCVGCGLCTEVCPADIPVSTIFMKTGEETAEIFDYIPGRDIDEPIPVTVFKEEEFAELGES